MKLKNSELIKDVFYYNNILRIDFHEDPPYFHEGTYKISEQLYKEFISNDNPDKFFKEKIEQHLLISIKPLKENDY